MSKENGFNDVYRLSAGNYFIFFEFEILESDDELILSELSLKIFPFLLKSTAFGSNYLFRFFIFGFYFGLTIGYDDIE